MTVGLIFDVTLAAVFAVCVIVGLVRGALRMILQLLAAAGAAVAGWLLCTPAAAFLVDRVVAPRIIDSLVAKLVQYAESGTAITLPFGLQQYLPLAQLSGATQENAKELATSLMNGSLYAPVLSVMRVLCVAGIFLIVLLILLGLARLANKANEVPVIGPANRVFGGLAGALIGLVMCYALAMAAHFTVTALSGVLSAAAVADIAQAKLYNWLIGIDLFSLWL